MPEYKVTITQYIIAGSPMQAAYQAMAGMEKRISDLDFPHITVKDVNTGDEMEFEEVRIDDAGEDRP